MKLKIRLMDNFKKGKSSRNNIKRKKKQIPNMTRIVTQTAQGQEVNVNV